MAWQKNPLSAPAFVPKSNSSDDGLSDDSFMDQTLRQMSERAIETAFCKIKPKQEYVDTFFVWQELYQNNRKLFKMTMTIHSNPNDMDPHVSVQYSSPNNAKYVNFHLYGMLNKGFYVNRITMAGTNGISTIAEF